LIELDDRNATVAGLKSPSAECQRASLIALDQMDGGNLMFAQVLPFLRDADDSLQRAAMEVITRRPAWAGRIA